MFNCVEKVLTVALFQGSGPLNELQIDWQRSPCWSVPDTAVMSVTFWRDKSTEYWLINHSQIKFVCLRSLFPNPVIHFPSIIDWLIWNFSNSKQTDLVLLECLYFWSRSFYLLLCERILMSVISQSHWVWY